MSASQGSNFYHSTAEELQSLSSLTEEAKLYREAAKDVLSRPKNKSAGPEEKDLIMASRTLDDLLKTVNEEREKNELLKQNHSSAFSTSAKSIVDTLNRFEKAITSMAQAKADIAMLIWGPVQFIVIIAREIFDTLDRLEEIGQRLKHCLERYKIYTSGHDLTGPLRTSLVDFYAHIIQFSITVSQIYRRRKFKLAAYVFSSSVKAPFEQFLKGLDYLSDVINKDTTAENFQNIKNLRFSGQVSPPPPLPNIPIPEQRHFLVPDLLSNTFSGRDDVLACIHRSLRGRPTGTISRVAIWGIPGIGKTQIALRFANRYSSEYQNVFYVNASSSATILSDYRSIIRTLLPKNQPPEEFDEREIQDLFAEWLVKNQNWLLIYDNAIRPASVRGYTPVRGSGHIIFTTRNVVAAEQLAERKDAYEVLALPMTQAVSLILHLQNIVPPVPQAEQAAARLAQAVQGLPIAIEQAVLLARLRGISLAQIIPDFEKRRDKRRELLQQSHPASMHEDECSVGALVTMTLETLSAGSPQAHSLFKLLVYFDPSSIPISFLTNSATELQHHFARQETYDRGLIRTPKETKEAKFRALEHVAFHDFSPLEKDFWFSRGPFRSKTPVTALPKIESEADKAVERFYKGNRLLQDALEKDNRIENALLDLQEAGLIRRLNDKTVWIHDLFAQLTIAILEEESLAVSQIIAHLVLLITYLSFPIPDRGRSKDRWRSCLPHATCILTYCAPFYKHLTMGPELAHLTASALYLICSSNDSPESRAKVVQHYKLAHAGYHYAWGRLKGLPWITEGEILLDARAEYNWENAKGLRNICRVHRHGRQRFGSSPAARTLQTLTNLAEIYNWWEQYPEAVNWATLALKGFRAMYGEIHDETFVAQQNLLKLYKAMPDYGKGYAVGKLMARNHMKKWGAGLVSLEGAGIALDIGDCAMGLANFHEAGEWYQITLRGLASFWGDDDRTQLEILQRLVRTEQCQHNHTLSLQYALRAERIYHQNNRQEESQLRLEVLTPIQLAVALQHFERGNSEAAREWVEMVFVGPEWTPLGKEMKFRSYRSIEDMRLRAIWLWGCMEYGDANVQDWEIAAFNIGKDFTHEACSRFGPLRNPCCAGVDRGTNGYRRLTKAEEIQILVDEADEMVRSWDRECEMRSRARQLTSSVSATDQG